MPKFERHLYKAADRLRPSGSMPQSDQACTFGILFRKRCS